MDTELRYADCPSVEVDTRVDAPPDEVWPHVVGLDAMVSASRELQSARWLDEPGPGARLTGTNHRDEMGEWTTVCVVTGWEPARLFGWDVHDSQEALDAGGPPMASWRFTLTPESGGTRLAQWARMGPARSGVSRVIEARPAMESRIVAFRLGDFERSMRDNLEEIARRVSAPRRG